MVSDKITRIGGAPGVGRSLSSLREASLGIRTES